MDKSEKLNKIYLAHITEDGRKQTVYDHLKGTAELCKSFATFAPEYGYLTAMLHDIGKYSDAFQQRLLGGPRVDHSTAGAYECIKIKMIPAAFCIAGHHAGLPDGGSRTHLEGSSLFARINRAAGNQIPEYGRWSDEVKVCSIDNPKTLMQNIENASFFVRMLFSCLVDADYIDTETFMCTQKSKIEYDTIETLEERLVNYVSPWFIEPNELNSRRCEILKNCMEKADKPKGIFTLTVPTGGGKTISSLAFALKHAKKHGMKRVIYVIPYTSIIEQNAEVFRNVLGDENILENHSNVEYGDADELTESELRKIEATENWDSPVIVTTAVQFFESLFSNRPSKCRKLHNIVESVIIFDEAQMIPVPYIKPCVYAIAMLIKYYGVTAVLCTATQPALNEFFKKYISFDKPVELCPQQIFEDTIFKRVKFEPLGAVDISNLGKELNNQQQVLCIVNSRKKAKELYKKLEPEGAFHLSTLMCPAHRKKQIRTIRQRLKDGLVCRVISTSLIEAGVDLDFPRVYREEAGLDSVLQAAGRCNREGKRSQDSSTVTIFKIDGNNPRMLDINIAAGRVAMEQYTDISSKEAVSLYFKELFDLKGEAELDRKNIMGMVKDQSFPFEKIAREFKLIDSITKTVFVPFQFGINLIAQIEAGNTSRAIYRKLSQYSVAIQDEHFKKLLDIGKLRLLDEDVACLADPSLYDENTGLVLDADSGQALFI